MQLDFSMYHGDHRFLSKRCWKTEGGPKLHFSVEWQYHYKDQVFGPWHKYVLCKMGKHSVRCGYRVLPDGTGVNVIASCWFCDYRREPNAKELAYADESPFLRHRMEDLQAKSIEEFYGGNPAPLPDGVVPYDEDQ